MKTIFESILHDSKKNHTILAIYDDKNDISIFYVGYILEIFEDSFILLTYDEMGYEDGIILIRKDDIFKIEKNTTYLANLFPIIKYLNQEKKASIQINSENYKEDGIRAIIEKCYLEKKLLSLKLIYDDYVTGIIMEYDEESLLIKIFSNQGKPNGITMIKYEDINNLAFDRKEEKDILFLIKRNEYEI